MTFNRGDCFYSKTRNVRVIYESAPGTHRVDPFYCPELGEYFSEAELGEYEPLVRDVHYKAALRTAVRLKHSLDDAWDRLLRVLAGTESECKEEWSDEFRSGWEAALEHVGSAYMSSTRKDKANA